MKLGFIIIMVILILFPVWLMPIIIAFIRHHPNKAGIIILDIFLGLTFIGWLIALIWAESNPNRQTIFYYNMPGYYPQW